LFRKKTNIREQKLSKYIMRFKIPFLLKVVNKNNKQEC